MKGVLLLLSASVLLLAEKTDPRLIHQVEPRYTHAASDARVSGTVKLALTVDAKGVPEWVEVVRPLGYGLDENAIAAVRQWRFAPATDNGKPVARDCDVEIEFNLITSPPPDTTAAQYKDGSLAGLVFQRR